MTTEAIDVASEERGLRARGLTASLFVAALLAFLLPFGTVSCGTPVTFTGLELATSQIHGDDPKFVQEPRHRVILPRIWNPTRSPLSRLRAKSIPRFAMRRMI